MMTRTLTPILAALMLTTAPMALAATAKSKPAAPAAAVAAPAAAAPAAAPAVAAPVVIQEKVVYHINDSAVSRVAMRNVQNHANASPDAKIVVVTHGKGIDFLLKDAKDEKGETYQAQVAGLNSAGVEFRVCRNTLVSRKLDDSAVIMDATVVPSGVAEIGRLQAKEGFAYLKP